jgi:hypothetical protein
LIDHTEVSSCSRRKIDRRPTVIREQSPASPYEPTAATAGESGGHH